MKEGKLTLPVIHALLSSENKDMYALAIKVRKGNATDEDIAQLVRFTHEQGGIVYTEKIMDKIGEEAILLLDYKKDKDTDVSASLSQYVHFVIGRVL